MSAESVEQVNAVIKILRSLVEFFIDNRSF